MTETPGSPAKAALDRFLERANELGNKHAGALSLAGLAVGLVLLLRRGD
ncbi:MAG: hypothetical protein QOG31_213 [Thermoplasmata archaeon]|jgi:hypothetical protein|nr:hypothetical protein [Thermoplasmata archaeon]